MWLMYKENIHMMKKVLFAKDNIASNYSYQVL